MEKGKNDKDCEVRLPESWIGLKPSFEENDKLFTKYKVVNRVHNHWKVYFKNKDKNGGPLIWKRCQ